MANQISFLLFPVVMFCVGLVLWLTIRRRKKKEMPKVHAPHAPTPGYDTTEIARSKGRGMADGGM